VKFDTAISEKMFEPPSAAAPASGTTAAEGKNDSKNDSKNGSKKSKSKAPATQPSTKQPAQP